MKLCSQCRKKPWPYAIAVFISAFAALLTWLTLAAAGIDQVVNRWLSVSAFIVTVTVLLLYMVNCMRRHCREDGHVH